LDALGFCLLHEVGAVGEAVVDGKLLGRRKACVLAAKGQDETLIRGSLDKAFSKGSKAHGLLSISYITQLGCCNVRHSVKDLYKRVKTSSKDQRVRTFFCIIKKSVFTLISVL
jgi:hypothetical protein